MRKTVIPERVSLQQPSVRYSSPTLEANIFLSNDQRELVWLGVPHLLDGWQQLGPRDRGQALDQLVSGQNDYGTVVQRSPLSWHSEFLGYIAI